VTAEVLWADGFFRGITPQADKEHLVCNENMLIFHFYDGSEVTRKWKDRSRSQSWTDEMKATAVRKPWKGEARMPKVTMIPATINPLTHLPSVAARKRRVADTPVFPPTAMSSSPVMKPRLIITPNSYSPSRNGSS
jgi:hypothetical protein